MDFGASFVQRFERSPKRGDVLVRRRQAACELDELVGMWIYLGISDKPQSVVRATYKSTERAGINP